MAENVRGSIRVTYPTAMLLQTIRNGGHYGFEMMARTGLASGAVYPALWRLERAGLVESRWESERIAAAADRPPRRYYRLTRAGEHALVEAARRYPLLERIRGDKKP